MSGCGKSHIASQYVLQHGGIYISFKSVHHARFLAEAQRFILEELHARAYMTRKEVGTFAEENEFTQFAFRAITLIPLTFIEFATYFNDAGKDSESEMTQYLQFLVEKLQTKHANTEAFNLSESDIREAFIRTTLNGGVPLIFALYKRNLSNLAKDASAFQDVRIRLCEYARTKNYRCVVYDEAHSLANILPGQFLHSCPPASQESNTNQTSQTPTKLGEEQVQKILAS